MISKVEKYKIAIVGAGPAVYFITQAFQNTETGHFSFDIGVIERLPTPLGVSEKYSGPG
jgi:ferredoxin--NADP+ reductase